MRIVRVWGWGQPREPCQGMRKSRRVPAGSAGCPGEVRWPLGRSLHSGVNRLGHYRARLLFLLLARLQIPLQLAVRVHHVQILGLADAPYLVILEVQVIRRPVTLQRAIRLGIAAIVEHLPPARGRHGSRIGDPVEPLVLLLNAFLLARDQHRLPPDPARRTGRQSMIVAIPREFLVSSPDGRGRLVVARSRKVFHREHLLPSGRLILLEPARVMMVMMMMIAESSGEPVGTQPGEQLSALQPLLLHQQLPIPRLHLEVLLGHAVAHSLVVVAPGREGAAADGTLLRAAQQGIDAEADLTASRLQIRRC